MMSRVVFYIRNRLKDRVVVQKANEGQQSMNAFDQFQGAAGIGLLEASIELFASERAELSGAL